MEVHQWLITTTSHESLIKLESIPLLKSKTFVLHISLPATLTQSMTHNQRNWFLSWAEVANRSFPSFQPLSAIDCDRLIINYIIEPRAALCRPLFLASNPNVLREAWSWCERKRYHLRASNSRIHIYIIISGKQSFTLIIHGTCPGTELASQSSKCEPEQAEEEEAKN